MSAQEHLRVLRERWLTVVAVVVLAVGLGAAYLALRPPVYTAALQMYVSSPAAGSSDSASLSGAQLAQDRVKSYQELVTSPRVLTAAIAATRLPLTVTELRGKVNATVTDGSVVMVVNVSDASPETAAAFANAVGNAMTATVDSLERPTVPGPVTAPVMTVRAVEPAPVPEDQSSAGPKRVLGIAFLLGLAIGVATAISRNAADNSVRAPEQLAEIVDAPNLGQITVESNLTKRPLIVIDEPNSATAEDFRRLRTNLQFIEADKDHKVLAVCSALPAEGKTTTAVNLALALAAAGHRVLLIDADLRRPAIAERFGLDNAAGLTNVLAGAIGLFQAVQNVPAVKLDVLTSGTIPPNPSELLASAQNARVIEESRARYDVVLIDTPPLLPVSDAAALAPATDASVLVCRANRTSSVEARRAAEALRSVSSKIGGVVLVGGDRTGRRLGSYSYAASSQVSIPSSSILTSATPTEAPPFKPEHDGRPTPASQPDEARRRPQPRPRPQLAGQQSANGRHLDAGTEQIAARWNGHA